MVVPDRLLDGPGRAGDDFAIKLLLVPYVISPPTPGRHLALAENAVYQQQLGAEMVKERTEQFLLSVPRGVPYALQGLGHAYPIRRPARFCSLVSAVRSIRSAADCLALFVGFSATTAKSDFSRQNHRLRLLAFPARTDTTARYCIQARDLPRSGQRVSAHAVRPIPR
jgi:hypothetical protein